MNNPGHDVVKETATGSHHLRSKKAVLGFDGFIDSIVKVVREKRDGAENIYFDTTTDFAQYILDKGRKNFAFELQQISSKLGGNMPIMANALAKFGIHISCIGALGYPAIHPIFKTLGPHCALYSFAEPGLSTAFEFNGNKMMMAEMKELNAVDWDTVKERVSLETLIQVCQDSDLFALLNWSEILHSTAIWRGMRDEVLQARQGKSSQMMFFDLSDCSRQSGERIKEVLELLNLFAEHREVNLSLNWNEASIIAGLLHTIPVDGTEQNHLLAGESIYKALRIHNLIIHDAHAAWCWHGDGVAYEVSQFVEQPVILTGAGDNFNAGYCAGRLAGQSLAASLQLGHAVSNYYLRNGNSPTLLQLFEEAVPPLLGEKLA